MNPGTRNLGLNWIRNCAEANSDDQVIRSNFIEFVNKSLERNESISSFDIISLIMESNKNWSIDSKKDFLSKWLSEYENIIQGKIQTELDRIQQRNNNFTYSIANGSFTATLDVINDDGSNNKVIYAFFPTNLLLFQEAINSMNAFLR